MAEQELKIVEVKLEDFFAKVLSAIGKTTDEQIAELLKSRKLTLAVAESVTSGLISQRLTNYPGSSDFFIGGIVCYHPRIKVIQVGVPAATISKFGAASKEVAIAMAEGIKKRFGTDLALAATGVAGPDPIPPTPVGKVYLALASSQETEWKELNLQGTRSEIREKAAQAALGLLWLNLGGKDILQ
ncbi:damage-inducible protein CinA [Candidatus Saganbacteria bacterium CG08_land_8_20_14_0_20_45_16]|uniref:Damage-inducible protein CinA n=1 Tax=Candidatus Saganbacteria bacterium CG08_land_8_20_14_0_20_45_16 TaxID=2014293 RepID=A0A2H0Y143_UNCSA|nr:MAG: damage-inducible protein CinA [Candidatus Saganbacteria bacterium CG08_land_8_20_14_0_20_45_16]